MATSKIVKKIYKDGQEYLIFGSGGAENGLPEGGTVGQVVKKTATGAEWSDEAVGFVVDETFGPSWNGVTDKAPSMNAVYDVLGDVETLLANI